MKRLLPKHVLVSLHNSLSASFLQYSIAVWGLTYDSYIKAIFTLQVKAVGAITFENSYAPSSLILLAIELMLQDSFELTLLCFFYGPVHMGTQSFHFVP